MKRSVILSLLFCFAGNAALAQTNLPPCRQDKLNVSNGMALSTKSGLSYKGYPGTAITLNTWFPLDRLEICPLGGNAVKITNLSKKNQSVNALQIYPANPAMIQ